MGILRFKVYTFYTILFCVCLVDEMDEGVPSVSVMHLTCIITQIT